MKITVPLLLWLASAAALQASNKMNGDVVILQNASPPSPLTASAEADMVRDMPGWGKLDSDVFSGSITVDEARGRSLFYVFVTAEEGDPSQLPVVLWLNGGPGCSSVGGGFLSELGPFYPTPGGQKLVKNDYSWARNASMLFVESPAFVGFSYSNDTRDARVGDDRTAADNLRFLLHWFERFPQFKSNDFYLSGESYAGHYVPQLAIQILEYNDHHTSQDQIHLKGLLVGNAWTDPSIDNECAVKFWHSHGITSSAATQGILTHCDFSAVGPLVSVPMVSLFLLQYNNTIYFLFCVQAMR